VESGASHAVVLALLPDAGPNHPEEFPVQIVTRHTPAFGVARCQLDSGERIRVESGAMMATSAGVAIEAKVEGGLMKGLKRSVLGGESLFITSYTAPAEGGWVDVAAHLPGDLVTRELTPDRALFLARGAWLASPAEVEVDAKWGGFKALVGGEGGFLIRLSGSGPVVIACYGALDTVRLGDGERLVLDSGHMVAFEEGVQMTLRRAVEGRSIQSLKSGEGFVFEFVGPGEVLTQTRNPGALVGWLTTALPFERA
jgi:uncharacterized protein (TIGR00266 family)